MQIKDIINFLLLYKSITSKEKVEKVVYEPKTPIKKKYLIKFSEIILFSKKLIAKPIINEPNKLTKKVPNGKPRLINFTKYEVKYLKSAPIAPPNAIQKIFVNLLN